MTTLASFRRHIPSLSSRTVLRRLYSSSPNINGEASSPHPVCETDLCGVPLRPTWSVNQLLASYPSPEITPKMINRLHELSALKPPLEGTPEYQNVKESLQEMVRLVEAVRSVDTTGMVVTGRGEREDADRNAVYPEGSGQDGQALLKNSQRVDGNFYVVDSERKM